MNTNGHDRFPNEEKLNPIIIGQCPAHLMTHNEKEAVIEVYCNLIMQCGEAQIEHKETLGMNQAEKDIEFGYRSAYQEMASHYMGKIKELVK